MSACDLAIRSFRLDRPVALIFGGASPEHEISIKSAVEVAAALDRIEGPRPVPIYVDREGRWRWSRPSDSLPASTIALAASSPEGLARHYQPAPLEFAQALLHLTIDDFATAMIVMHGANGEDGRLQGAFELAGIRFTGSGSAASSLAMDKTRTQACLSSRGLPIPRFLPLQAGSAPLESMAAEIESRLGLPCVVKPALCGSSVGLSIVTDRAQLVPALERSFALSPLTQAEEFLEGREFTCGVLEVEPGTPEALPVTEIVPPEGRFFDYEAKYTPGMTRELTPAPIPEAASDRIRALALEAHRVAGCEGFSRVDFIALPDASAPGGLAPRILEINTIPGMTETSLLPQAAAVAGHDMTDLVKIILRHSLARGRRDEEPKACGMHG